MRSLLVAAVLLVGQNAFAQDRDLAAEHVERGTTSYNLGRFDEALDEYGKAYEIIPAPELLFNIGQCHYRLKHYERAIFFFELYLRETPSPTTEIDVDGLIAEAKEKLAVTEAAAPKQPPRPTIVRPSVRALVESAAAPPPRHTVDLASTPKSHRPRPVYEKWWFWTAVGGAVAVTAATIWATRPDMVLPMGSVGVADQR